MCTATTILEALKGRHPASEWIFLPELRIGTGYGRNSEQRIDAWAMHTWPSKNYSRTAYEIKVSRADFLKEIKQPLKRRRALLLSNMFFFAVPADLVKPEEIPEDCGLVYVTGNKAKVVLDAPWHEGAPPTWNFMASVYRAYNLGGIRTYNDWICVCGRRMRWGTDCAFCHRKLQEPVRE